MTRRPHVKSAPTERERVIRRILEQQGEKTMKELAAESGIKYHTLGWWKSEIRRRDRVRAKKGGVTSKREAGKRFLPVEVARDAAVRPGPSGAFAVRLRTGHEVLVPPRFDRDGLRDLVVVLETV